MKRTFNHYGRVVNGKKIYDSPELQAISVAELEGQEFEEVIQKRKHNASKAQYGYLFGGIFPEALESETFGGWTENEIESHYVGLYLSYHIQKEIKLPGGKIKLVLVHVPGTLKGINKDEMQIFIDKVIRDLAEQGIVVKNPNEYYYGKYK